MSKNDSKAQEDNKELQRINEQWNALRPLLKRKEEIRKEKAIILEDKKKLTTTKRLILFIFGTFTLIEIFTGYLMLHQMYLAQRSLVIGGEYFVPDMSPQIGLISAIMGEVIAFAIYAYKSLKENTKGGIIYETVVGHCNEDDGKLAG